MTPAELAPIILRDYLDELPEVIGDPEAVARWPRDFLLREIGAAQRQACLRQDLRHLFDDTTAAVCTISLEAGQAAYDLDPRVLRIDSLSLGGHGLHHVTRASLDENWRDWRVMVPGAPRCFFIEGRRLSLVPAPSAAASVQSLALAVWRLPLADPDWNNELEWPGEQERLAHWVAYRALMRPNPDTVSVQLAKTHLDLFDQEFGAAVPDRVRAELLAYPDTINLMPRTAPWRGREEW